MYETDFLELIKQINISTEKSLNTQLKNSGLTYAQVKLLLVLRGMKDCRCEFKDMEHILGVAQSTTVSLVEKLRAKGYLSTRVSPEDKRVKLMELTDAGIRLCSESGQVVRKDVIRLFSGISQEELRVGCGILEKMFDNIRSAEE